MSPAADDTVTNASRRGGCDCGGVRYRVSGALRDVHNCHCGRCRRITGHHMAATATDPANVTLDSDSTLTWYHPVPDVHYGFCSVCGSTLFWRADGSPGKLCIAAGTLDQPTGLHTTKAWWVSESGDYHERQQGVAEFDLED
jgi:hypothetical protein